MHVILEGMHDEAHGYRRDQFRWFAGGWKVNAELPGASGFAAATQFVRPKQYAEAIPCGPDVAAHVEAVRPFVDARVHPRRAGADRWADPGRVRVVRRPGAAAGPAEEYGKPDDVVVHAR